MESAVYLGVDIGKSGHYALAVDASGKPIYQTAVPNDEAALRKLVIWAKEHQATLVVDQPGGAAALLLRLCWASRCASATCTDWPWRAHATSTLARARPIQRTPSSSPTWHAHTSRVVWLEPGGEALAHLELLCGYDVDLRGDANRLINRLRALLVTHWPALERALGERLDTRGVLAVLQQYPSGPAVKDAGIEPLTAALKAQRVRRPEAFARQLYKPAMAQTVTITGSETAARFISGLAVQLAAILMRRDELEKEIEQGFFALPGDPA